MPSDITLTAAQLLQTRLIRCSMFTPEGVLVGWEADHYGQYGGDIPGGDHPPRFDELALILAGLLRLF